jgi:hypothetical protein
VTQAKKIAYLLVLIKVGQILRNLKRGEELDEKKRQILNKGERILNIILEHAKIIRGQKFVLLVPFEESNFLYKAAMPLIEKSKDRNALSLAGKYPLHLENPDQLRKEPRVVNQLIKFFAGLTENISPTLHIPKQL